jgi:hypothetical protein
MRNACAILALLTILSAAAIAAGPDAFHGNWTVTVTPSDGGKPYEDRLVFKGGKFLSLSGKKHGFEEAPYEADTRGGQLQTFTANPTSKKSGTAKWTGTVAAGQLTGTFTWTKADGTTADFSYTGTKSTK